MSVKQYVFVALDLLGVTAVVLFAWERISGVPMDWFDWLIIGYTLGVFCGAVAMLNRPTAS